MTDASRAALRRTELTTTGSLAAIFALRMFGLFMLLPVFAVYGAELDGATPLLIGTAIGAYGLMQALLQIPFGMLSDRFGRRPLLLIGLLLFGDKADFIQLGQESWLVRQSVIGVLICSLNYFAS